MILYQLLVHILCWAVRIMWWIAKVWAVQVLFRHCAGKTEETIKIKIARVSVRMHIRTFWRKTRYTNILPLALTSYFLNACIYVPWIFNSNYILIAYVLICSCTFITEVVAVCDICGIKVWHVKEPGLECWRSIIILYDKHKVYQPCKINQKGIRYTYKSLFRKMNHILYIVLKFFM
jgi:uncharacterized membrane protein